MSTPIITISRQYGSGGREIGKRLADELRIPFYDRALIELAAKKSGFDESLFDKADQQSTNSLFYSLSMLGNASGMADLPIHDKLFLIQSNVIREVAEQGPCVIVGRCADYVLQEMDNVVNLFIHSDIKSKVKRAVSEYDVPEKNAEDFITKIDKKRATYYKYYTGMKWGWADNFHLCLYSDSIGISNTVKLVQSYINMLS